MQITYKDWLKKIIIILVIGYGGELIYIIVDKYFFKGFVSQTDPVIGALFDKLQYYIVSPCCLVISLIAVILILIGIIIKKISLMLSAAILLTIFTIPIVSDTIPLLISLIVLVILCCIILYSVLIKKGNTFLH